MTARSDRPRVLNLVTSESARFFREQRDELLVQGVESESVEVPQPTPGRRSPVDYVRFGRRALARASGEFDVVHANYGLTAPAAFAASRAAGNLPVVLSLWGSDLYGPASGLSRVCARFADATIVMSERMARDLDQSCFVIPHGIDTEKFYPREQGNARADVGWADDRRHVLFPYGTDRDVKDYPRARRVADRAAEMVDAPVELQTVTGVSHAGMNAYYNAADALLLTSKREGSPNAVKEALAADAPVVATDVGDVRERLEGVTPAFVGDDDAELTAALARILRSGERSNGRTVVASECSVETMAERIREVYRRVR
ncbi:glycosyltransferase family 4 protein [Halobacterium zhouii]|uniref:glycosyltransferase family 4 protein n=1 Tax=Halobacterium zhouii TaxID=2902624 RepID=UPI001E659E90|nr:glycosyltransferase family 4 protein [Halobacterium zhouii]